MARKSWKNLDGIEEQSRRTFRKDYTFDDWVNEWDNYLKKNPEFKGMSLEKMKKSENEIVAFCASLSRWVKNETSNLSEQRIVKQMIFGRELQEDRSDYTFDDWVSEWNKHPTWKEKNIREIQKDGCGASGPYASLSRWIKKETKDPYEQRIVRQMILGRKMEMENRFDYTFDDWAKEWNVHPEWKNMSTEEMRKNKEGACKFYDSLTYWTKKNTKDPYEERIVKKMILGKKLKSNKPRSNYTFDDWVNEWNSHPEWKNIGISTEEMRKDKNGAMGFYNSLSRWVKKDTMDHYEQRIVKQMILGRAFYSNNQFNMTGILEDLLKGGDDESDLESDGNFAQLPKPKTPLDGKNVKMFYREDGK